MLMMRMLDALISQKLDHPRVADARAVRTENWPTRGRDAHGARRSCGLGSLRIDPVMLMLVALAGRELGP